MAPPSRPSSTTRRSALRQPGKPVDVRGGDRRTDDAPRVGLPVQLRDQAVEELQDGRRRVRGVAEGRAQHAQQVVGGAHLRLGHLGVEDLPQLRPADVEAHHEQGEQRLVEDVGAGPARPRRMVADRTRPARPRRMVADRARQQPMGGVHVALAVDEPAGGGGRGGERTAAHGGSGPARRSRHPPRPASPSPAAPGTPCPAPAAPPRRGGRTSRPPPHRSASAPGRARPRNRRTRREAPVQPNARRAGRDRRGVRRLPRPVARERTCSSFPSWSGRAQRLDGGPAPKVRTWRSGVRHIDGRAGAYVRKGDRNRPCRYGTGHGLVRWARQCGPAGHVSRPGAVVDVIARATTAG